MPRYPLFTSAVLASLAIATLAGAAMAADPAPANNEATRAIDRAAGTNQSGAYPLQSDGMPGNPPGTAVGRAVDRATGTPPAADPPGTALGRAIDRAAGTNQSGAYPAQSDGTRANPPGTAVSRALGDTAPRSGPPATSLPSGTGTN